MTFINWISFSLVMVCVFIYTAISYRKVSTNTAYFVSTRQTTFFALTATLVMTELNTSTLLGFASMGYKFGSSAIGLSIVFLVGLTFYAITVAKKWKQFDGIAVTTFFSQRFNPALGYFAAVVLTVAMLGFSANYLKSLTLLFTPLFPSISIWGLSAIFCTIMLVITIKKGLSSIIRIDKISFCLTLLIFMVLFIIAVNLHTDKVMVVKPASMPNNLIVSLTIITMFTYILSPWYGQKIFSAKSTKVAFYSVIVAAFIVAILYGIAIFSTSRLALTNPGLSPDQSIPFLIANHFPIIIQGISYAVLFLIAMTTLAALWNTIASIIVVHIPKKISLNQTLVLTITIALITYILANVFINDIFAKMVLMNIPIASLAFGLLAGFYWRSCQTSAVVASMVVGLVGGFFCYFYFGESQYIWYWAVYVIPLQFIVGVVINETAHIRLIYQKTKVINDF